MNIFLDAISKNWIIILFDNDRNIIKSLKIDVVSNESSKLIDIFFDFIESSALKYEDISNIVCVNWPWSFTWIRTIVLMVNTINFIINKNLTAISFFDLFDNYPIVKKLSKRDCFIIKDRNLDIENISLDSLKDYLSFNNINRVYWDVELDLQKSFLVLDNINYIDIIKKIKLSKKKIIDPLYIKKPSIS